MQQPQNQIVKKFKSVGSQWLFNLAVEEYYPVIVKNFRNWLKPLTPDKIQEMIKTGELPELDPEWFQTISGYRKYLLKIKIEKVAEIIYKARKDLAAAIMESGDDGHIWLNKLYVHLLECVDHPDKLLPEAPIPAPAQEMVMARCESCNKTWPVKKEDFARIEKCPFCGVATGAPSPPPTEKPEEIPAQEEPEETA